ncbi:SLAM family member 9-like [Ornithorhynchus anatinus]|uniref:SLAM family member 9-like n=1 Tax=Ornithorhynchus anatinus TaxID=9258 RepID=UPI0019D418CD|nr:SLAM family member 9-like [Ornithorhynchus anatinus]
MLRRMQSPLRQAPRVWVQKSAGMGLSSRFLPLPLLLLLFLQPWAGTGASRDLIGAVWGSVTFPLDIQARRQVKCIKWTSDGDIATVIPGGPGKPPRIVVTAQQYMGRLTVSTNLTLTISPLSLRDTGTYRADVNTADTTTTTQFSLRVYDRLGPPTVTVNSTVSDNGRCTITLTCCVATGENDVTFSWMPLGPGTTVSPDGSVLSISQRPRDPPPLYTCTATNPISGRSRTVPAYWNLCPDPVPEQARLVMPFSPVMWMLVSKGFLLLMLLGVLGTRLTLGQPHRDHQRDPRAGAGSEKAGCPLSSCSPSVTGTPGCPAVLPTELWTWGLCPSRGHSRTPEAPSPPSPQN